VNTINFIEVDVMNAEKELRSTNCKYEVVLFKILLRIIQRSIIRTYNDVIEPQKMHD
jgi:hypothetical protein